MLKYVWMVTQDLFLTVTFASLMYRMLCRVCGKTGQRIDGAFLALGCVSSVILAAVKYNTNKIISSHWNHYIYAALIISALLFFVFTLIGGRKEAIVSLPGRGAPSPKEKKISPIQLLLCVSGGAFSAIQIFYTLPGVLLYPFSFNTMGNGYLSQYYMVRLSGWLLGFLILLVYSLLLSRCARDIRPYAIVPLCLNTGILCHGIYCFGRFFVPWVNRAKWLKWPIKYDDAAYGWIGSLMMFTAKNAMLFIWIVAVLAALFCVIFFAQSLHIKEPYSNSAQKRKLMARNRSRRRISSAALSCVALCVVIMTAVKAYDTRVIELSAPETYTVEGESILIPVENVSDGHLHRFEYRTEKNVDVRWIVVKKPGSASFGVGLDACEVCGNAGYFERNGQVICKRCDVVMNINTIGFKGGCNPIPLPYSVSEGNLVFALSDILAGEKEFR